MTTYADAGVNIELGDDASKVMYEAAKLTWVNREGRLGEVVVPKDDFSGVRTIDVGGLPSGTVLNMGFDGVGTKVELAERIEKHDTVAFDLFAMVCDDAVVYGGEPVLIGSILDVNSLNDDLVFVRQLAAGYVAAAEAARVAVVNGEIAELGARVSGYGDFNYNWGATVVWFGQKDKLFTGDEIEVGDKIITLREKGFRSNGMSLLRKIMEDNYGAEWHKEELNGEMIGELALEPSQIYCAAVVDMFEACEVHGVAHITGGGIPGKLGRVLDRAKLGAKLEVLYEPCNLMKHAMDIGGVDRDEAFRTWNMGNGMMVIMKPGEEVEAIRVAKDHGIEAQVCGEVVDSEGISM
jgi:phosphoribosylformylglycinamidine cyclo-ligase